jgi:hypothetical protein
MEKKTISVEIYKPQDNYEVFLIGEGFGLKVVNAVGDVVYSITENNVLKLDGNETRISLMSPFDIPKQVKDEEFEQAQVDVYKQNNQMFVEGVFMDNFPITSFSAISENNQLYSIYHPRDVNMKAEFEISPPTEDELVLLNEQSNVSRPIDLEDLEELFRCEKLSAAIEVE